MNSIKWETIISNLSLTNQTTLPPPPPPTTMNDVKFSNQLIKFEAEDEDEDELYRNFFQNSTTVSIRPSWPTASEVGHDSRVTVTDREKSPAQPVYSDTFTCHWIDCNQSFTSRAQLVLHIEYVHIDQQRYCQENYTCYWMHCPRQHKPFNARYKLLNHMRIHSGEKPNKCPHPGCTKAFSRMENLKIHIRSHTGEKPYQCPFEGCDKAFSNSSDRAKHQRTHFNSKPYACQVANCTKRYTDPSSLRKHMKSHGFGKKFHRHSDCPYDRGINLTASYIEPSYNRLQLESDSLSKTWCGSSATPTTISSEQNRPQFYSPPAVVDPPPPPRANWKVANFRGFQSYDEQTLRHHMQPDFEAEPASSSWITNCSPPSEQATLVERKFDQILHDLQIV